VTSCSCREVGRESLRSVALGWRVRVAVHSAFAYAAADVVDHEAVAAAVDELEAELGPVTALIHGAGMNTPVSLVALEPADFGRTAGPKLAGLENLLDRLEPNSLRFIVGFGSVIAQIGLPGEADYAWANERMSRRIEEFSESHPEVRCLSVEWSIWSGVGMGERLGRVETLAAMNIAAISPDEGVRWLGDLLRRSDTPVRTILTGRFGMPPTLEFEQKDLPLGRFLERVRESTPGVELVVDAELSKESDPYLADHVYRGDMILPGVMGLEAMAQVATALNVDVLSPIIERVEFLQAIDVPRDGKRVIRIAGLVTAPGRVELAVRSDLSEFQVDHFRATIRFERPADRKACPIAAPPLRAFAPAINAAEELYGDLFFHGGRFERVIGYRSLSSHDCDVDVACRSDRFFGGFQPQAMRLGDSGARDAAVHAIQACVPDREILPVAVERIETNVLGGTQPIRVCAHETACSDGEYTYDLSILDAEGILLESWHGLRLREVEAAPQRTHVPAGLVGPILERFASDRFADANFRAAVVSGIDRQASERAVGIALGADARLTYRTDGKPEIEEGGVSISHAIGHTLAVVASAPVACDFEVVEKRDAKTWLDLLGVDRERLARYLCRAMDEDFDLSATRVWGVL